MLEVTALGSLFFLLIAVYPSSFIYSVIDEPKARVTCEK